MNELKQCPFCGGDAEKRYIKRKKLFASMRFPYNTHYVFIQCKLCGATSRVYVTIENAIEAWNSGQMHKWNLEDCRFAPELLWG